MHGVKRDDGSVPVSAEERQVKADKIAKYNAAKTQCLAMVDAHTERALGRARTTNASDEASALCSPLPCALLLSPDSVALISWTALPTPSRRS